MGMLKELNECPKVVVDDTTYVPQELFKEYVIERLKDIKRDCVNNNEKDGIDMAIICVQNS